MGRRREGGGRGGGEMGRDGAVDLGKLMIEMIGDEREHGWTTKYEGTKEQHGRGKSEASKRKYRIIVAGMRIANIL